MKAILYEKYGPPEVLQLKEIDKPVPSANEILIRTHATTVTSGDWRVRSLEMPPGFELIARLLFGITKPRQPIIGSELAGVVEEVGRDVSKFKIGQRVFVFSGAKLGCYVEFKAIPEDGNVVAIPDNLSFEKAAALSFGGTTALDFFRKGQIKEGDKVLINGASGGVGTSAVQIAKYLGAIVTGVCSGANVDLVKSLGADEVINYTRQDISDIGESFDLIMDTVGTLPFSKCKKFLNSNGKLLLVMGGMSDMLRSIWVPLFSDKKIIAGAAAELVEDLRTLAELAEKRDFKPVIDKVFPVEEIIEAHRYVDSGRKKGSVVITWDE